MIRMDYFLTFIDVLKKYFNILPIKKKKINICIYYSILTIVLALLFYF